MTAIAYLVFEGHIPSKKNSVIMMRNGGKRPSKAYAKWHREQSQQFAGTPRIPSPVTIEYAFWIGGKVSPREFDLSNSEESVNDLLVDLGVIQDDSWLHLVERHGYVAGFVKGAGRCEVTVAHVPNVAWRDPIQCLKSEEDIARLAKLRSCPKTHVRQSLWNEIA